MIEAVGRARSNRAQADAYAKECMKLDAASPPWSPQPAGAPELDRVSERIGAHNVDLCGIETEFAALADRLLGAGPPSTPDQDSAGFLQSGAIGQLNNRLDRTGDLISSIGRILGRIINVA